jgi:hypothetical protein
MIMAFLSFILMDNFFAILFREKNKMEQLSVREKVKYIHCGMDYVIIVSEKTVFGQGNNSYRQLLGSSNSYSTIINNNTTRDDIST